MASISGILGTKRPTLQQKVPFITQNIHYSQFEDSNMQFYDCGGDVVERTADNIEMAGEVQAPVIVRKIDADRYEIISGHKRVAAVRLLVETRGLKKFAFIPTRIVEVDDDMAEYLLISTNDYPEKSDYERMMEVVRLYEIIPKIEAKRQGSSSESPITARMLRRLVARETSMCATRVGNFKNIYTHFTPIAMEAFKNKEFGINVAIKLASLDADEQDLLVKRGGLSIAIVTEFVESKKQANHPETETPPPEPNQVDGIQELTPELNDEVRVNDATVHESENQPYCNKAEKLEENEAECEPNTLASELQADRRSSVDYERLQIAMRLKEKSEKIISSNASQNVKAEARIVAEALSLWIRHNES